MEDWQQFVRDVKAGKRKAFGYDLFPNNIPYWGCKCPTLRGMIYERKAIYLKSLPDWTGYDLFILAAREHRQTCVECWFSAFSSLVDNRYTNK